MNRSRAARLAVAGLVTGSVLMTGCGHGADPSADQSADPSAGATFAATTAASPSAASPSASTTGPTTGAGTGPSAGTNPAAPTAVVGSITQTGDRTARVASAQGSVAIAWTPSTVIVDTVAVPRTDLAVGTCVLVVPVGNAGPGASDVTAAAVRVVSASSSCPTVPGAPKAGGAGASKDDAGGSVTIAGGNGVIGSVSAVSAHRLTLRTATGSTTRVVRVTTTPSTVFRKSGDRRKAAIRVGRCAAVWGSDHVGGRLVADRIRVSDPVGGTCGTTAG